MTDGNLPARRQSGIHPLLLHDILIGYRSFAASFRSWRDRLILPFGLIIALLWARDRVDKADVLDHPAVTFALGLGLSLAVQRIVARRLRYHAVDGVLAEVALQAGRRRSFGAIVLGGWCVAVILLAAAVRLPEIPAFVAGLGGGLVLGQAVLLVPWRRIFVAPPGLREAIESRSSRRRAGLPHARRLRSMSIAVGAAAATLAIAAATGRFVSEPVMLAVFAGTALACLAFFSRIDDSIVRFLAFAGYGTSRSSILLGARAAAYSAALIPVSLLLGTSAALLSLIAAAAILSLMVLRIALYRVHPKARADLMVTGGLAGLGLIGATMPLALVVVLPGVAASILRSSAAATWRMA